MRFKKKAIMKNIEMDLKLSSEKEISLREHQAEENIKYNPKFFYYF